MPYPTYGVQPAYLREFKEHAHIPCVTMNDAKSVAFRQMKEGKEDMSIWKIPPDGKPMLWLRLFNQHNKDVE